MNRSPPTNPDGRGRTISGVTVVAGLVLLVLAGAGLAVAMYLALGPFSLRRDAATQLVAESTRHSAAAAATDESATGARGPRPPTVAADASPAASRLPGAADILTPESDSHSPLPPTAAKEPNTVFAAEQDSLVPGVWLAELSPLEVAGIGDNAGAWHRTLTIGGKVFENTILLPPAPGEDVVQIAFGLQKRFDRLAGSVAIVSNASDHPADANQEGPQAVFRLYGDGNLVWESGVLSGFGVPRELTCEVRGVEVLTLVAESQAAADSACFAWCNPRLLPAGTDAAPATEQP
jgi:hypothetical protein